MRELRFTVGEIRHFYRNVSLQEGPWRYSRKHFRLEMFGGRWVKLNHFENRINPKELKEYLVKYVPAHAFMSVMDWLFHERVGLERKDYPQSDRLDCPVCMVNLFATRLKVATVATVTQNS